MKVGDALMDSNLFGKKRRPMHRSDFGDDATVGVHVKKIGEYQKSGPDDHVWGIYLGHGDDGWMIGTMTAMQMVPIKLALYKSLEELKQVWELD